MPAWVLAFNEIFKNGDQNEIKQALSDSSNGLKNVDLKNIMLYFAALEDRRNSLLENEGNGVDGLLTEEDVQTCIDSANEKAAQSEGLLCYSTFFLAKFEGSVEGKRGTDIYFSL